MTRSLKWLILAGLPALVCFGFLIVAQSRNRSKGEASSKPAQVAVQDARHVVNKTALIANETPQPQDEQLVVSRGAAPGGDLAATKAEEVFLGKHVQEGITVQFSMTRLAGEREGNEFIEGDDVRFRFRITDSAGAALTSVYPAAWLVTRPPGSVTTPQLAVKKAESMINASIFSPADLDLNVYYVLTLNANATITVVDPLFSYGGTKLLALIPLKSPGADWALSKDERRLYVSLPASHEVAVIDTATWEVREYVPGGLIPDRIALQPDGHYLWVAGGGYGPQADDSGVTVLSTDTLEVVARIRTGLGRHDLTFSDDSRFAFVTNHQQGTVSIIDVRSLKKRADIATGITPVSIDYSSTAQVAYVSHAGDGIIAAVSADRNRVVARMQAKKGLGQIKFAPNGRHGFVVNTAADVVHILDAANNQIMQTVDVENGPDQLAFSDELAYVRHRGSANILMIPLPAVGLKDKPVPVIDFPAGQSPAGQMSRPCLAGSMIQAPGAAAMLVANPRDRAVYFYKEGMAAPMGTFNNYSREPLAVTVVDRSLRERTAEGVYETVAKLREPDSYDVVFFLDAPRITHCFPIEVQPDPEIVRIRNEGKVDIKHLVDGPQLKVGKRNRIRFRVTDRNSGTVQSNLGDVIIQTFLVPSWHERHAAEEIEPGIYAIEFTPPEAGVYYISLASAAIGLTHDNPDLLIMRAVDPDPAADQPAGDSEADASLVENASTNSEN